MLHKFDSKLVKENENTVYVMLCPEMELDENSTTSVSNSYLSSTK